MSEPPPPPRSPDDCAPHAITQDSSTGVLSTLYPMTIRRPLPLFLLLWAQRRLTKHRSVMMTS